MDQLVSEASSTTSTTDVTSSDGLRVLSFDTFQHVLSHALSRPGPSAAAASRLRRMRPALAGASSAMLAALLCSWQPAPAPPSATASARAIACADARGR